MKKKTQKRMVTKKKGGTGFMKKLQNALKKKESSKKVQKVSKKSATVAKKVAKKAVKKKAVSSKSVRGKNVKSKKKVSVNTKKRSGMKKADVKKVAKNTKSVEKRSGKKVQKSVVKEREAETVSAAETAAEKVFSHEPVLLQEVCDMLDLPKKKIVVDATLGLGGHTSAFLGVLPAGGKVVGFDADADHLAAAQKRLEADGFKEKDGCIVLVHRNFVHLADELKKLKIKSVDGVLFDLGIASPHVDRAERGFSFLREGPLDMRFGADQERTAADIVNGYNEKELARIIFEYGEERQSRKIAREIVRRRKSRKFKTTTDLANFIEKLMGQRGRIHPATRVFQALRVEVNEELDVLKSALAQAAEVLKKGGRVAVISYHSLEDRIVKNFFRDLARSEPARLELITKKPVVPSSQEVAKNPRSRSAKLRVAQKL